MTSSVTLEAFDAFDAFDALVLAGIQPSGLAHTLSNLDLALVTFGDLYVQLSNFVWCSEQFLEFTWIKDELVEFEAFELDGIHPSALLQTLSYFGLAFVTLSDGYLQWSTFSNG